MSGRGHTNHHYRKDAATHSNDYPACRTRVVPPGASLNQMITEASTCEAGPDNLQLSLPQPQESVGEPVSRFKNVTSTSLTDQVNGLIMVLGNENVETGHPRGTFLYEGCFKTQGSLTTQINGMVVGVHGGCNHKVPAYPNVQGIWSDCHTVEKLPNGIVPSEQEIEIARQLDHNANHTVQLNGGLISAIKDNRIIVPQISQR